MAIIPIGRIDTSPDADHSQIALPPLASSGSAAGVQVQLTDSAFRPTTFFGSADRSAVDGSLFDGMILTDEAGNLLDTFGRPSETRKPLAEDGLLTASFFFGQQFADPGVSGPFENRRSRARASQNRTLSNGQRNKTVQHARSSGNEEELFGVPQISGVKAPAKPFLIGLVDVPGVGYANSVLNPDGGEFDPTRVRVEGIRATPIPRPEVPQHRSFTPAVIRLNVNPKDIVLSYGKRTAAHRVRASYVRRELGHVTGHVIEHHWDELDTISVSCVTGNFWVNGGLDYPRGEEGGRVGFQSASRTKSLAYRKLQATIAMFRNNGCSWITGATRFRDQQEAAFFGNDYNVIVNVGAAFMMYDNIIWYGHFETMEVNESGEMPHWFEFSLEFKVSRTTDLNGVDDADVLLGNEFSARNFFTDEPNRPSADERAVRSEAERRIAQEEAERARETASIITDPYQKQYFDNRRPEVIDRFRRLQERRRRLQELRRSGNTAELEALRREIAIEAEQRRAVESQGEGF